MDSGWRASQACASAWPFGAKKKIKLFKHIVHLSWIIYGDQ
jgi:hypothetical protein